jgi:electron transfer flavoprotein alpha subunit
MGGQIWAVVELRDGELHPSGRELLAAGGELAAAVDGSLAAVVLGEGVQEVAAEVASLGVSRVLVADAPGLGSYVPGVYVDALMQGIRGSESPDWVLFAHTYQSVDYMARVAHTWGAGVLPEIVSFEAGDEGLVWSRPILEGKLQAKVRVRGDGPMVVSVQSAAFAAAEPSGESAPVEALAVAELAAPERELLGIEEASDETVDLSAADYIVSVGRGIGGPEKMELVEELAAALGAEIGASRPVIDNDWLPRDRQIGSSGQTVAPKLYVAVGISGAIQHLVGMKGAACTVAVNKDAGAPIFTVADYGIVGDLFEVVPLLTQAVREARSE